MCHQKYHWQANSVVRLAPLMQTTQRIQSILLDQELPIIPSALMNQGLQMVYYHQKIQPLDCIY